SGAKIARSLRQQLNARGKFVPILVTGSREPIINAVRRGCFSALDQCRSSAARKLRARLQEHGDGMGLGPAETIHELHRTLVEHERGVAGTVVIIDELGKLLEFAARHPDAADVYSL